MKKAIWAIAVAATLLCGSATGQDRSARIEKEITAVLDRLAAAALSNNVSAGGEIYDDRLQLTSQSGKVYSKTEALADLKNPFEIYRNDDLKFIHLSKSIVVVNYQNTRKRKTLDEARFRVTAVFRRTDGKWRIVSLQSSRIANQGM